MWACEGFIDLSNTFLYILHFVFCIFAFRIFCIFVEKAVRGVVDVGVGVEGESSIFPTHFCNCLFVFKVFKV